MNTEMTGQQAEPTADAAVDAVETVIWRHEHGEEVFSGMLKDANEAVIALQQLAAAAEAYFGSDPKPHCGFPGCPACEMHAALAACRAVGGAR